MALTFHRWSSRTYILVVHGERQDFYSEMFRGFLASSWGTCLIDGKAAFTAESI